MAARCSRNFFALEHPTEPPQARPIRPRPQRLPRTCLSISHHSALPYLRGTSKQHRPCRPDRAVKSPRLPPRNPTPGSRALFPAQSHAVEYSDSAASSSTHWILSHELYFTSFPPTNPRLAHHSARRRLTCATRDDDETSTNKTTFTTPLLLGYSSRSASATSDEPSLALSRFPRYLRFPTIIITTTKKYTKNTPTCRQHGGRQETSRPRRGSSRRARHGPTKTAAGRSPQEPCAPAQQHGPQRDGAWPLPLNRSTSSTQTSPQTSNEPAAAAAARSTRARCAG